jgi:methionyl-tRNA synthetase
MKLAVWYHRGIKRWCVTRSDGMWTHLSSLPVTDYNRTFYTWAEAWAYAYLKCYLKVEIKTVLVPRKELNSRAATL